MRGANEEQSPFRAMGKVKQMYPESQETKTWTVSWAEKGWTNLKCLAHLSLAFLSPLGCFRTVARRQVTDELSRSTSYVPTVALSGFLPLSSVTGCRREAD